MALDSHLFMLAFTAFWLVATLAGLLFTMTRWLKKFS
jgi:hypothetical protein